MIEAKYQRNHTKIIITIGMIATVPVVVSFFVLREAWLWIGYSIAFTVFSFAILMILRGGANAYHRIKMQSIEREVARKEALFLHSDHKMTTIHIPTGRVVSHAQAITATSAAEVVEYKKAVEHVPNLLDVMQNWKEAVIVKAGQQEGKTRTAIACAYTLRLPTVFISIRHETKYHYPGMEVYTEEKLNNIQAGIGRVLQLLETYEPAIIFLDDITNLADYDIERVVKLCGTQAIAHNKRVFFTIHTLDKNAFGLNKVGAGIKNNFSLLLLDKAERDSNLNIIRYPTQGKMFFPGTWRYDDRRGSWVNDGKPVNLPGANALDFGQQVAVKLPEKQRICSRNGCHNTVTGNRNYCNDACKQKAYRIRKNQRSVTVLPEK